MVEDELRGKEDILNTDYIFITHSDNCEEGAVEAVAAKINSIAKFDNIYETNAGCVIGTHSGPGCLGIIYSVK
jgi:fatty acid-binding protein DegV